MPPKVNRYARSVESVFLVVIFRRREQAQDHTVFSQHHYSDPSRNRMIIRTRRGEQHLENALISCTREKELQLARMKPGHLTIDRWFASRFTSSQPYFTMGNEFRMMEKKYGNWETACPRLESSFVRIPIGGGNMRRISVNANIIGGGEHPTYVACEGPTQESVYDFWTLVWQENVNRILSVNFPYEERLYDQGYNKETMQYWPIVEGEIVYYMPYKLICLETRMMTNLDVETKTKEKMVYRITRLALYLENNILDEKVASREVIHMCFYRWPDARIPIPWGDIKTSRQASRVLMMAVEKELRDTSNPLLVHCHAGIGRTGVIISADMAIRQLRKTSTVNIREVVELLRSKRPRSVMNTWQYAMIHLIVAEVAMKERMLPPFVEEKSVNEMIDEMWKEVDAEVASCFGQEIVTFTPDL